MTRRWLCAAFLSVFMSACGGHQADVDFARRVTTSLVKGWYLARPMIDWPHLKMLEHDVGAEHERMPNAEEKAGYEKNFIDSFKEGFRSRGAKLSTFFNWRMYDASSPDVTIVAANCFDKSKVFLFFIKHGRGGRKLVEVKALNVYDQEQFYAQEQERRSGRPKNQ